MQKKWTELSYWKTRTPCEQLTKRVTSRLRVPRIGASLQQVTFEQWDNYEFTCKQNEKIIMQSVWCQIECPRDRKHSCTLVTKIWIRVFRVLFRMMRTYTWNWSRNAETVFYCVDKNGRRASLIQQNEHWILLSIPSVRYCSRVVLDSQELTANSFFSWKYVSEPKAVSTKSSSLHRECHLQSSSRARGEQ